MKDLALADCRVVVVVLACRPQFWKIVAWWVVGGWYRRSPRIHVVVVVSV